MAEQQVRVGFVGAGGIVRLRHVPGLKKIGGVELYGVVNRSRESSERAAEEFGIERVYDSWEELVQDPQIDVVWIGAQPYMHRPVTEAALEAGKHVFTQARMARSYADARAMYEAAQRHPDRVTMISPPPHYMRGDRLIRRLLREGFVGEPRNIVIQSFNDAYLKPETPLHWRQNWEISGYNTLDLGMMIEVLQRWLGDVRRVTAMAKIFTPQRPTAAGEQGPVERPDTVTVLAEMANGALATILCSGVAKHADKTNTFEIYGTEGTIRYHLSMTGDDAIMAGKVSDEGLKRLSIPPDEVREWEAEAEFVAAVRGERQGVEPSFTDGMKYMEVTEAIFRALESGTTVTLPLD